MKQFKALVVKEWHTHKHVFLVPAYTLAVICVMFFSISIYGVIRYGALSWRINANTVSVMQSEWALWVAYAVISAAIGMLCVVISAMLTEYMINKDHERKCEILHYSQPCSLAKILSAKLFFGIPLMLLQYIALLLISYIVASLFFVYAGFSPWKLGLSAIFKPFPYVVYSLIMIDAFAWIGSNLFRKRLGLKLISSLIAIEIFREILKHTWPQIKIPSPYLFIGETFVRPLTSVVMPWGSTLFGDNPLGIQKATIHLGVALLVFVMGYFINKNRELA